MPDPAAASLGRHPGARWRVHAPADRILDEIAFEQVKRVMDVVVCTLLLPWIAALMSIFAAAIKLSSPGPVLVPRARIGRGGHRFTSYVLRTEPVEPALRVCRLALTAHAYSSTEMSAYAHATRIGRFLQDTGLDRLPEFLNVLRGEMSLVGPRPSLEAPEQTPLWLTARLEVRPGLTGLWRFAGERAGEEASRLDIAYVRNRNVLLDVVILLRTLRCLASGSRRAVKRTVDLIGSGVLLLLSAPLMILIAVAVRVTSPGPILFRQERVGKHGRVFRIMKFRTMRSDAEAILAADPALYSEYVAHGNKLPQERDPRITPLGRWLRRTSLDELPQLANILLGDMSLVGPRPILLDEVEHYGPRLPRFCSVPPGLTGSWQISGRSALPYPQRCDVELDYIRTWSLAGDATILLKTVGVVLSGRGAT